MPSFTRAGAAMVAVIRYAGMDGSPIPRIIQVIMVRKSVNIRLDCPSWMMALAILSPNPVRLTTPMMIPTTAQATATETTALVPSENASRIWRSVILVVFLAILTAMVATIAQKAEKMTV